MDRFKRSLIGYYNYYCITDNTKTVNGFKEKIEELLYKWLNKEVRGNHLPRINSGSSYRSPHFQLQELK